jgi:hypothetical protein
MRLSWTILGLTATACLAVSPAYANSHAPALHGKAPTTPVASSQSTHTSGKSVSPKSTVTTSATSTTKTGTPKLNPIAAKISSHPQLDAKITAMLPKGMTLNQASKGFKNQGQFIAALHASQNLGCDCFTQLQTDMTKKHMSLGQAIQDVKKTANATVEAHTAETEANDDVKSTTRTATSTLSAKNNTKKTTHSGSDQ